MWLFIACLGYAFLAIVALLDKIVVSRERINPLHFTFLSTIILAPCLAVLPFVATPALMQVWPVSLLAGSAYALALYTMYRSFEVGEVSHNGPLIGAITPLCTFVLAALLLPEPFSGKQLGGIGLLIIGSLIISFVKNRPMHDWHTSALYSFLAGLFFALFFIASKMVYVTVGFGVGLLSIFGAMGLCGILLFVVSSHVRTLVRRRPKGAKKGSQPIAFFVADKLAAGLGVILIQYALSQGSPTIINALSGLQYGLLVILVIFTSRFFPKLYAEKYEPGEVLQEGSAVAVISLGLALLVL